MVDAHRTDGRTRTARLAAAAAPWVVVGLCLAGHLGRLRFPSLYYDDLDRIRELQTTPLGAILLRPFNEHVAPFFQVVSWVTWQAAGRRLVTAPVAFTLASFVPFVVCIGLLMRLVGREVGSGPTAWLAAVAFSVSWLHAETIYWYSASSFTWALLWTLVAWLGVLGACKGVPRRGWVVAGLASLLAPACSGVGLLAGPVATLRALNGPGPRRRSDWLMAFIPLGCTALYLGFYAWAMRRGNPELGHQIGREIDLGMNVVAAVARATVGFLLPGLLGLHYPHTSRAVEMIAGGLLLGAVLLGARRSPQRPLILGGLALMLGGYFLTYPARTGYGAGLVTVERYHLFPQLGLALLLAPAIRAGMARCEARRGLGPAVAIGLAVVMLLIHAPGMRERARPYHYPDQPRTLAAIDRLATTCRAARVTRAQALGALCPIRTRWSHFAPEGLGCNPLAMLPETVETPGIADAQVRSVLLAALTPADRESLCGGMDASRYLVPLDPDRAAIPESVSVGHLVASNQAERVGADCYRVRGWWACLEYELDEVPGPSADHPPARYLQVPGKGMSNIMEVWWTGKGQPWSPGRSLLWFTDREGPDQAWAVPLDQLPHWNTPPARLRVVFHAPGVVTLGPPRLLR